MKPKKSSRREVLIGAEAVVLAHALGMKLFGWLVALVLIPSLAVAQQAATTAACRTPIALDDGWQIAVPEAVGMDGARLCGIAARDGPAFLARQSR